jgi:S-(hydroxymethyl)glutathione dehydrogenase/alcohol dehydrogenase
LRYGAAVRAAVLEKVPGEVLVDDVAIAAPGPREVLIRTVAAGVCHSDLHFVDGIYPHPLPLVPGHESAGVVEAVGDQVSYVQPGDHVITCLSVFCGSCEFCLSGRPALCTKRDVRRPADAPPRLARGSDRVNQFLDLSSFAEQMLVHEHALVKIRPDMPLDRAALLGCGVTTGLGAVFRTARVEPGQTVAVIGCGGIGLSCIQGAVLAGATRVIAVDKLVSKLDLAQSFGATDVVDAGETDPVVAVQELTDGGVDHAFEAIGLARTAEQAFAMARRGGTATVIGMIPPGEKVVIPGAALLGEKRLQGSLMGSNQFRVDMPRYVELYLQGRLKLDELVSARIGLDGLNAAFQALRDGSVARSVVVFE